MQTTQAAKPVMTFDAIRADKWAAVDLPIPANADPYLLNSASFAAFDCFNDRQPPQGVPADAWQGRRDAAGERVKELADRMEQVYDALPIQDRKDLISTLDHGDAVRAWQAPAFSEETMAADPWTAVYLPIPENANLTLLTQAHNWARDLAEYARRDLAQSQGAFARPDIALPEDAPEPLAAATARTAELGTAGKKPACASDRKQ
jgi:hypothetical protein